MLVTLLPFSCKTVHPGGKDTARATAVKKLGEDIEAMPNASGQYILFTQKLNSSASGVLRFMVIALNGDIIEEQDYMPGYVKWVTETSLEVLSMPGMAKTTDDPSRFVKVIHLRTPN